jgi:hypothetical protein
VAASAARAGRGPPTFPGTTLGFRVHVYGIQPIRIISSRKPVLPLEQRFTVSFIPVCALAVCMWEATSFRSLISDPEPHWSSVSRLIPSRTTANPISKWRLVFVACYSRFRMGFPASILKQHTLSCLSFPVAVTFIALFIAFRELSASSEILRACLRFRDSGIPCAGVRPAC